MSIELSVCLLIMVSPLLPSLPQLRRRTHG